MFFYNGMLLLKILPQLFLTFVSKAFSRDASLQTATQFNLHAIVSMCPIIHQQEVGVVVVKAGEAALALDVHQVMGRETTLQTNERRRRTERKAAEDRVLFR